MAQSKVLEVLLDDVHDVHDSTRLRRSSGAPCEIDLRPYWNATKFVASNFVRWFQALFLMTLPKTNRQKVLKIGPKMVPKKEASRNLQVFTPVDLGIWGLFQKSALPPQTSRMLFMSSNEGFFVRDSRT